MATCPMTAPPSDQHREYCYMDISIAGSEPRTVVFLLDTRTCPKTSQNFAALCASSAVAKRPSSKGGSSSNANPTPTPTPTYRNTEFHRIKPGFMVQGGDFASFDGTGGHSIHGSAFPDESFAIKHDAEGILSMANRGANTNGSQFFVTLARAPHLDGKHVAFGKVVHGMNVIREMASVEVDERDRPIAMQRIVVVDCGVGMGNLGDVNNKSAKKGDIKKKKKHRRRDRSASSSSSSSSSSASSYDDDDSTGIKRSRDKRRKRARSQSRSRSRDRNPRRRRSKERRKKKKRKSKSWHRDREDEDRRRSRKHSSRSNRKHRKRSRSRSR